MKKYVVTMSNRALRDLDNISSYIAIEKNSPEVAVALYNEILDAIIGLEDFPHSHPDRNVGIYAGTGCKQLTINNYIVIYSIDDENYIVEVDVVRHQKQNT